MDTMDMERMIVAAPIGFRKMLISKFVVTWCFGSPKNILQATTAYVSTQRFNVPRILGDLSSKIRCPHRMSEDGLHGESRLAIE